MPLITCNCFHSLLTGVVNSLIAMTDWLLAQVAELSSTSLIGALGVVMMLDAIPLVGVLVPGDAVVLVATGVSDRFQTVAVLFGVVLGCVAGWSMTFVAGRYYGDRIRAGRVGTWIGAERWATAERALGTGGPYLMMAAPFLPVLNALLPLAAGGLRMSYRRFALYSSAGAALWASLYITLGVVAGAVGDLLPSGPVTTAATVAVGMTFGWLVLLAMRRKLTVAGLPLN